LVLATAASCSDAFSVGEGSNRSDRVATSSRREIFDSFAGIMGATLLSSAVPAPAFASGGATAGKYT